MVWSHRLPRVYRYLERQYVDDFFVTGRIMLSSFQRFAAHLDEQRLDSREGKTFLIHRTEESGGQTLIAEVNFGHNAYVLCGSLLPSLDVMQAFGADSGIIISDIGGFSAAVADALPGFVQGFDGPCSYQLRRIVEQDLGWLDLGPTEANNDILAFDQGILCDALSQLVCPDVYFLKHHTYVQQAEWRLVWLVDRPVEGTLVVEVPEARRFCKRWESQGDVVAFGCGRV